MKYFTIPLAIATLSTGLSGCASNPGVASLGGDQYMISRQAASGFHGLGPLKVEAMREAGAHCVAIGKELNDATSSDSQPPYILGNFPRTEVIFTCA